MRTSFSGAETMDLGLKGKVAMITGAGKKLGRAMAKAFGEEGRQAQHLGRLRA
jgi:NAD(P)-dependent dehydrogenase (short-subunit alcohol dehydrogenase family)